MPLTAEDIKKIRETHDAVIRIVTLLGNGNPGLIATVGQHTKSLNSLWQKFWLLVGILVGSGVLAGSIVTALQLLSN